MHASHADFSASQSLRVSLKRGLAREAIRHAAAAEADIPRVVAACRDLRPNARAVERHAQRLGRMPGVVGITRGAEGLVLVLRNVRAMVSRDGSEELFTETTLFYTRMAVRRDRLGTGFKLSRASFCLHALERLVERTEVALDRPLLPVVDAEAARLLRGVARGDTIGDDGDWHLRAGQPGTWSGSLDRSAPEADWGLSYGHDEACIVVFAARTFLSPAEMRPTLWLRWRDDPALTLQA